jgi:Protein of unknown function (DUF3268).
MKNVICPYCNTPAKLSSSCEVYQGRDYGMIWICANYPRCDSYVGVHDGTDKPLGRMANRELRFWKKRAHAAFDPFWKTKKLKRVHAYSRLSRALGIPMKECHIGMFDVEDCKRVIDVCINQGLPDFRETKEAVSQ